MQVDGGMKHVIIIMYIVFKIMPLYKLLRLLSAGSWQQEYLYLLMIAPVSTNGCGLIITPFKFKLWLCTTYKVHVGGCGFIGT